MNAILNLIIHYGSILLAVVFCLVTIVQLITEVIKRLLPKIPTDLVVIALSITLTVLTLIIFVTVMEINVMWYYVVGAVVLGIVVSYAAMFGWDKFTTIWTRLIEYLRKDKAA